MQWWHSFFFASSWLMADYHSYAAFQESNGSAFPLLVSSAAAFLSCCSFGASSLLPGAHPHSYIRPCSFMQRFLRSFSSRSGLPKAFSLEQYSSSSEITSCFCLTLLSHMAMCLSSLLFSFGQLRILIQSISCGKSPELSWHSEGCFSDHYSSLFSCLQPEKG